MLIIDYIVALTLAKVTFLGIWLSTFYYLLRKLFIFVQKTAAAPAYKKNLLQVVQWTRVIHPYLGLSLLLFFPYHAYMMLATHSMGPKTLLGALSLLAIIVTMFLGLVLWRNKVNMKIRVLHRRSMFFLLGVVVVHTFYGGV